jgi:hypothetical protein
MSSKFKPWLMLGLIFAIGVLTGSELTVELPSYFTRPPGEQQMKRNWMINLVQRLKLTSDQQSKILPILADAEAKIQLLHHDEVQRGSQIIKQANEQLAACLTPAQVVKLQEMETAREKLFADHFQQAPVHRDGPGGDGIPGAGDAPTNGPSPEPKGP